MESNECAAILHGVAGQPLSEADMDRVTHATHEALSAQETETIFLYQRPADEGDPLPDETVCVNGYTYQIKRGRMVEVPKTVAEILRDAGRLPKAEKPKQAERKARK